MYSTTRTHREKRTGRKAMRLTIFIHVLIFGGICWFSGQDKVSIASDNSSLVQTEPNAATHFLHEKIKKAKKALQP